MIDEVRLYGRELSPAEVARLAGSDPVGEILFLAAEERTAEQEQLLRDDYLHRYDETYRTALRELEKWQDERRRLKRRLPTVMVMREMETPRPTHVLRRGDYRRPGERVAPDVPDFLPPLSPDAPRNRLGLARWLVDEDHPLTARVAVNRQWQRYFGRGLVATPGDFGRQGERPSHPRLLDWLATEFVDSGWDVKALQQKIVLSATYRQSSQPDADFERPGPASRLLARGPRARLTAEMIRDQALYVSGLLHERIGGPSVFPYQPAGLWREVAFDPTKFTTQVYRQSSGEDLYRRSLYTFYKRACPPPALTLFDAPSREVCTLWRRQTNTPLQALVLMNDPTFVEAARHLAARAVTEAGPGPGERIAFVFRRCTSRLPGREETAVLGQLYEQSLERYVAEPAAAEALLGVGESGYPPRLDAAELAAWTIVCQAVLNLDETITK